MGNFDISYGELQEVTGALRTWPFLGMGRFAVVRKDARPAPAPKPAPTLESLQGKERLCYAEAAIYAGYSIRYLRNLVSADAIPHYDGARSRRFRRDMLDLWLTNRDAAMRKFSAERQAHHGD